MLEQVLEHADFKDGLVHSYRNPAPGMLIGADLSKDELVNAFNASNMIEIGGDQSKSVNHAIVFDSSLFVANKPSLLVLDV